MESALQYGRDFKKLKHGYYPELSNHIEQHGPQSLKKGIQCIIGRMGFTHFSLINPNRPEVEQTKLSTLPKKLVRLYHKEHLYCDDMIVQSAIDPNKTDPFFSTTICDYVAKAPFGGGLKACMESVYALNKQFAFYDYLNIPVSLDSKHKSHSRLLLSVTIQGLTPYDFQKESLPSLSSLTLLSEAIAYSIDKYIPDLFPKDFLNQKKIGPKPLRVLDLLANSDCTIEQIARNLSISTVTANHHLKLARSTLGATTNYAAIRKAVSHGLISYRSPPTETQHQN